MLWCSMKLVQPATNLVQVNRFLCRTIHKQFQVDFLAKRRLSAILPITPNPVSNIVNVPGSGCVADCAAACEGCTLALRTVPATELTFSCSSGDDCIGCPPRTLLTTVSMDGRSAWSATSVVLPE